MPNTTPRYTDEQLVTSMIEFDWGFAQIRSNMDVWTGVSQKLSGCVTASIYLGASKEVKDNLHFLSLIAIERAFM